MIVDANSPGGIRVAAERILAGGLVAFPTETVYGLGALALSEDAVRSVFRAKGRPADDPLIVHVHDVTAVSRVAELDPVAKVLADAFWPGPLTLVVPKHHDVPDVVTSGLPAVAVRIPGHRIALELLAEVGEPVVAPSANPFGRLSPTTASHVAEGLGEKVDVILDGGPTPLGIESTVLRVSGGEVQLLRPGAITSSMIAEVTGLEPRRVRESRPSSPGQLESHYAPRTPIVISEEDPPDPQRAGLLTLAARPGDERYRSVMELAPDGDLRLAANRLFDALHRLDAAGCDLIIARPLPECGLGEAIMDRLNRAAAAES